MITYVIRRLLATFVVMAVVAFVVFSLLYLTPGDPAAIIAGDIATSEDIKRIHERLGLDDPFLVQFGRWVNRLSHGDLGTSIFTNLPVTQLIAQRVEPTLSLTLCTLVVAIAVAVPLGVVAAAKAGTWFDRAVMAFSVLGFSDIAGLSIAGAKWPLDAVQVPFGSSLTISNEVRGALEITLGSGRALLLAHPYPQPGH